MKKRINIHQFFCVKAFINNEPKTFKTVNKLLSVDASQHSITNIRAIYSYRTHRCGGTVFPKISKKFDSINSLKNWWDQYLNEQKENNRKMVESGLWWT